MCRIMRHNFSKVSLRKNILFIIFCSIQTHGQSLDSSLPNYVVLYIYYHFVFVKQLTLLSPASYHATMHYLYVTECYHVYHLECINKYMYIFVDKPN